MAAPHPLADAHFAKERPWRSELLELRRIALEAGLAEAFKWYQPCYTHAGGNVLILGSFKEFCTIGFFKGVLLDDPDGLLQAAGPNTRSARIVRITSAEQVLEQEAALRKLIAQAMLLEEKGVQVDYAQDRDATPVPPELEEALAEDPELKQAFEALTPGRRRAYLLHFNGAKKAETRVARIEKCRDRILAGKGWNER